MSDPYYQNVSLLLHCDGSNGSTTFTDSSYAAKTVNNGGGLTISTAQSKFGGASLLCASGKYLYFDGLSDFAFGTGDFTIEGWARIYSQTEKYIYDSNPGTGNGLYPCLMLDALGYVSFFTNGSARIASNWAPSGTQWFHVALCRATGVTKLYINGVQKGSSYTDANNYIVGTNRPVIGIRGDLSASTNPQGYLDEIRVTKGIARYTANFTPPTEAFPDPPPKFIPTIGNLTITGLTSSLAKGFAAAPSIRQIDFTGLQPQCSLYSFMGTPLPAELAITGQMPDIVKGFAAAPAIKSLTITGDTPAAALGWSAAPTIGLTEITGLQPLHSKLTFFGHPLAGQLDFDGLQPGIILGFAGSAEQRQILETGLQPAFANRLLHVIENYWISTHYHCYLTGGPDGLADLELPISSFQTRMSATPAPRAYLSVIVPGVDDFIIGINARPNGRLKVDRIYNYLDGSSSTFAMVNVPFESLTTNQGGRSGTTGTLSGFEESAFITPQTIELFDPITRSYDAGGIRYRCRIDPRVRPNDTVIINEESFLIESVIHIIDTKTAIMEVKEKL